MRNLDLSGLAHRDDRRPTNPGSWRAESGSITVWFAVMLVPLVLIVGSATVVMRGRDAELQAMMRRERAFLAAEAGIDAAVYRARTGALDAATPFSGDVRRGMHFDASPSDWLVDGRDNDGNGQVDDPAERLIGVTVTGSYRGVRVRLEAMFESPTTLPFGLSSPIHVDVPGTLQGLMQGRRTPGDIRISGIDTDIDGSPAEDPTDVYGITLHDASGSAHLVEGRPARSGQYRYIQGVLAPITVTNTDLDVSALVEHASDSPDVVLGDNDDDGRRRRSADLDLGDAATNDWRITYARDDVILRGVRHGAGILVVTGDLKIHGDFRFDGLVIVGGNLMLKQGSTVNGAIVIAGERAHLKLEHETRVQWSTEALRRALTLVPPRLRNIVGSGTQATPRLVYVGWRDPRVGGL